MFKCAAAAVELRAASVDAETAGEKNHVRVNIDVSEIIRFQLADGYATPASIFSVTLPCVRDIQEEVDLWML
jgi:hypothetical protein